MKGTATTRRMEAGLTNPMPLLMDLPPDFLSRSTDAAPSLGWTGILAGLRRWYSGGPSDPTTPPTEQDVGVHIEFDTDVVDALVYTVGRWMGLNAEQLRDSPGLRTLVSRNIQWFRSSPDWMKLAGLVLAKKLNQSLDCPPRTASDTQRMLLLDRLMQRPEIAPSDSAVLPMDTEETTPKDGADDKNILPSPGKKAKRSATKKGQDSKKPRTPKKSTKKGKPTVASTKTAMKAKGLHAAAKRTSEQTNLPPKKRVRIATTPKTPAPKRKRTPSKLQALLDPSAVNVSLDTPTMEVDPPFPEATDPAELHPSGSHHRLLVEDTRSMYPSDPSDLCDD